MMSFKFKTKSHKNVFLHDFFKKSYVKYIFLYIQIN